MGEWRQTQERLDEYRRRVQEIHHLGAAMGLLGWDQETYLPAAGVAARAPHVAALAAELVHQRSVDPRLGDSSRNSLPTPAPGTLGPWPICARCGASATEP